MKQASSYLRHPSDLGYLWHGKPRATLVRVLKNMGITDICTCEPQPSLQHFRYRPGSSSGNDKLGMKECLDCHYLQYPMQYIYDCDECMEPFLLEKFPPPQIHTELLCFDCAAGF